MESRGIKLVVLVFWLASMSWLAATKIAPLFAPSETPDQRAFRPEAESGEAITCWSIHWDDRNIGWARSKVVKQQVGFGMVQSVVHFEELPVKELSRELFGAFSAFLKLSDLGLDKLTMTATNHMEFDPFGTLQRFRSSLELESLGELFRLKGEVEEGNLRLRVLKGNSLLSGDDDDNTPLVSRNFDLPEDALVADSMTPQSRLAGLSVGQSWRFRAYRAIPPHDPFQTIEAVVEREEMFPVGNDVGPVKVVTFTPIGGSGLTTSKKQPSSTLRVTDDGTVVNQKMQLGNVLIEFRRRPDDYCQDKELP
ncbi:MAG: hypothetical protein AAF497_11550 [Planctomycetota bacterium]